MKNLKDVEHEDINENNELSENEAIANRNVLKLLNKAEQNLIDLFAEIIMSNTLKKSHETNICEIISSKHKRAR